MKDINYLKSYKNRIAIDKIIKKIIKKKIFKKMLLSICIPTYNRPENLKIVYIQFLFKNREILRFAYQTMHHQLTFTKLCNPLRRRLK